MLLRQHYAALKPIVVIAAKAIEAKPNSIIQINVARVFWDETATTAI